MDIEFDGEVVPLALVRDWELRRARAVAAVLRRKSGKRQRVLANSSLLELKAEIALLRNGWSRDDVRQMWRNQIAASSLVARFSMAAAGSRRKVAAVRIRVNGLSAMEVSRGIDAFMLEDSIEHEAVNLGACPDHHLLQPAGATLEVIETTGGSPLPSQFFLAFNDESGLSVPRDNSFEYQSAGTARTSGGAVIGGVRHQFKDIVQGTLASLAVEFPATIPNAMIRQHQWHLACEWSNWFDALKTLKA